MASLWFTLRELTQVCFLSTHTHTISSPPGQRRTIEYPAKRHIHQTWNQGQRVGVFNFGTDRVRVLEKNSGSGSGTDRVWVLALHFYQSDIIGY